MTSQTSAFATPKNARRIVCDSCPLTEADLDAVRLARSQMMKGGYSPLAVHSPWSLACDEMRAGKAPIGKNWQDGHSNWRLFGKHPQWARAGANTGLLLGKGDIPIQALDFDINDAAVMAAVITAIKPIVPRAIIRFRTNSPRLAMLLRCEPGALKEKVQGERGAVERLAH